MSATAAGDRIDIGKGQLGIIVEVLTANLYVVSWPGGSRTTVAPDCRAHIESGYFGRLIAEVETAARAARSEAARRGWATRRARVSEPSR